MTNTNNLETLQSDVNQVAAELVEVKKLEDEALKKSKAEAAALKAETLLSQVVVAKEEASKKLETLKGKTDATSMAEISRLETEIASLEVMLQTLNSSKADLAVLKEGVASSVADQKNKTEITEQEKKEDKQNKYDEKKGWLQRQVDGFSDSSEENHTRKNVGRVAMGVGVGILAWKGIKALFGLFKKKETTNTTSTTSTPKEKLPVWKKILIGLGVGTGGYYLVHGLVTGKRNIKDFFDWKKNGADNHDESKTQVESYEDLIENHPEDAEKYEAFGGNVDSLYENIFSKELEAGRQDDGDMNTVAENTIPGKSLKGLVPFCMDNSFTDVGSMLSERGIGIDLIEKNNEEIKTNIVSIIKNAAGGALQLFLKALPSWAQFAVGKNDEEKAAAWMAHQPDDRIAELKLFFREQMRVTTFLKTKEGDLIKAIAAKKYAANPEDFDDVSEAIEDDDWFEENVENDSDYKLFRSGKILDAYGILDRYGVMNGELDEDTKTIVEECDTDRDDILFQQDGGSILDRCQTDIQDGTLETKNKDQLTESCEKITEDIKDLEGVAADKAMDMYGRLFNTENANKDELLNNSTILPLLQEIRKSVPGIKQKIQSGQMTAEDMVALKLFMNNYFALKKELEIGTQVYQLIKSDDGNLALTYGQLFSDSIHNMAKGRKKLMKGDIGGALARGIPGVVGFGLVMSPIAVIAGGYVAFKKGGVIGGLKYAYKSTIGLPLTITAKVYQAGLWSARKINGRFIGPAGSIRRRFFGDIDGPKKLLVSLEKGNLSLAKANEIVISGNKSILPNNKKLRSTLYSMDPKAANRKILEQAFTSMTMTDSERDTVAKYFDKRSFNSVIVANNTEGVRLMKAYEAKLSSLTSNQKKLFDLLSDSKKLSSKDLDVLIKNIEKIQVNGVLTTKELKKMVKLIQEDFSIIHDIAKLNAKLSGVNKSVISASADLLKAQDEIVEVITKESDALKTTLKNSNIFIDQPISIVDNYYKIQVDGLETFKLQVKSFTKVEVDALKQLQKMKFKATHIAELFALGKTNPAIEAALKTTDDLDALLAVLKTQKNTAKIKVSDDLIKVLEDIQLTKVAGKYTDEILDVATSLFKFVAKIT